MTFPEISGVPHLTTAQMREVDRAMIEDYGIRLIQMMENAGRNLARLARARFLNGAQADARVIVLAGSGGNGGGALVAARHLHNWGMAIEVVITKADEALAPVPRHQLGILRRMEVPVSTAGSDDGWQATLSRQPPALLVDGIIGYGLQGTPQGPAAAMIRWANAQGAPTLSLDTPSGLDTTSGTAFEPAIRATATMTLALPKAGMAADGARPHVGELYLADIGVPPALYAGPGLELDLGPIFAAGEIVRIARSVVT